VKRRHLGLCILAGVVVASCAPTAPKESACLQLELPENGFSSASPAKLSMLFTVSTCLGEPVPGLTADNFEIYEDDQPVSAFESQKTIQPKGQRFRFYTLLALDLSGSMLKSGNFPVLRDAAIAFVDQVMPAGDDSRRVALATFDGRSQPSLLVDFTHDPSAIKAAIAGLEVRECTTHADCAGFEDRKACASWRCVDDSTNLNGAVVASLARLDAQVAGDEAVQYRQGALVVFTDGRDQAARVSASEASTKVDASEQHVFTVGLGGEVNRASLQALGKDGFHPVERPEELGAAFQSVATRVSALAQRFYLLEYCSPKRGGKHELRVEARAQRSGMVLTGALSTSFDASQFESGCEVGPAQLP
jgi:VWFA-related protein